MQGEDGEDGGGVIIMFTVSLRTEETENHPAVDKRCVEMLNLLKIKEAFYRFQILRSVYLNVSVILQKNKNTGDGNQGNLSSEI